MKNTTILLTALLISFSISAQNPTQYPTMTDLTFTDVDGQTHNLYNLLGQGYRVILDFGFIGCGPCAAWSQQVGPELWDQYGPDGDNSLRMFYFEVNGFHSDQEVDDYYSNLGVEYPIVNIQLYSDSVESQYQTLLDSNFFDDGYPRHVFVCQDTTYRADGGYDDPVSFYTAEHILDNSCNGQDVHYKDVALVGLTKPFSYCTGEAIEFIPQLEVYHNGGIEYNIGPSTLPPQEEFSINDTFMVKTYINNIYLRTDTLDPLDTGGAVDIGSDDTTQGNIGAGVEWEFSLPAVELQVNDSVKFELLYPEDSYMLNNTHAFKVEEEEETKTATDNQFRLVLEHSFMYVYFFTEDQVGQPSLGHLIDIDEGYDTLITINNGQCHAMAITGTHLGNAYLIQQNNNDTIFSHPVSIGHFSPYYFFHVDSTVTSIGDYYTPVAKLIDVQYFDLLGRTQKTSSFSKLPQGAYIEVKRFDNGKLEQRKLLKLE